MLHPIIDLISEVFGLYLYCVIAWTILSTLISFKVVNAYQLIVRKIYMVLDRLCEPALRPIQKFLYRFLGDLGGIDISPIVLILLINFIRSELYQLHFYL